MPIDIPLMKNNIEQGDIEALCSFIKREPILTQSRQVQEFEKEWGQWLGCKHSVFVNSGSSANLLTMFALKNCYGTGEIIVPVLTWSSDIASILHAGHKPVFVDIDLKNLAMNVNSILEKVGPNTRAVFLTHVLGFNGISQQLIDELQARNIPLIEDVCESHGALFRGRKLGSIGFASNFSFYYAHHMTTIEGGMISTNDEHFSENIRLLRSHGLVREMQTDEMKRKWIEENPDLNPEFIFAYPGFNVRSTELNAVLGRNQLKRLDANNLRRQQNCHLFYQNLDSARFWTDFDFEGSVNYAFVIVLNDKDEQMVQRIMDNLKEERVEFRRGTSGGGNQLRQPYLRNNYPEEYLNYPVAEHVHFFGFYVGNYPSLSNEKILKLCRLLNA